MKGRDWGDVGALLLVLAIVFVLVRPGSIAAQLVTEMGNGFTAIVGYAVNG